MPIDKLLKIKLQDDLERITDGVRKSFIVMIDSHPEIEFERALREVVRQLNEYNELNRAKQEGELKIHISAENFAKHFDLINKQLGVVKEMFVIHENFTNVKNYQYVDRSPKAFGMQKMGVKKFKN